MYKLYWVEVDIKTEDWFVIAKSLKSAEKYFADYEGFDYVSVKARFVCDIGNELVKRYSIKGATHPPIELLQDLNCKIFSHDVPRIVNYNGEVFIEGSLSALVAIDIIDTKEGVYIIKNGTSNEYKIGITKNIKKRLQQFSTGNAYIVRLLYFIYTKHYKSLEKHLHDVFKSNRIRGEWFSFNEKDLQILRDVLALLNSYSEFEVYDIDGVHKQLNYRTR